MTIMGLGPGAQVIILQAFSAYSAIVSAYFFARPALRGQAIAISKEILSDVALDGSDEGLKNLRENALGILSTRSSANQSLDRRANSRGIIFLAVSEVMLTGAVALQITTDPSFVR
jgi:hypothetical protein